MSEKVIAAILSYNAGDSLQVLVSQLVQEQLDDIYILDDCSTDGSVLAVQQAFPQISVVSGSKNIGPAGNRNRILDRVQDQSILFIDADMQLSAGSLRQKILASLGQASVGMAGGYILSKKGSAMGWNYGHEMHPRRDALFDELTRTLNRTDISDDLHSELIKRLESANLDYNWIDPELFPLRRRQVDWVAEGLFTIKGALFKQLGGYDEHMPYHEGQDLAKRVRETGFQVVFDPSIIATHLEIDVRHERRSSDWSEGQYYFYQKHWGMSRKVFDALFN